MFEVLSFIGAVTFAICSIWAAVQEKYIFESEENTMAKSKIIKANEKIADSVTKGYKKIESSVVGGYKKIEDKFVDQFLTKDGETIEEAKSRLNEEQAAREQASQERHEEQKAKAAAHYKK